MKTMIAAVVKETMIKCNTIGGKSMEYGICRISTAKQNILRQERNIRNEYPNAVIIKEVYTGTKLAGRKEFEKVLARVKAGDTLIFDSVSRMSRNADEGCELYEKLFLNGVNLVFLREKHINTEVYKKTIQNQIELTGGMVDVILKGINEYLLLLAKEQIRIAFEQSQKEVDDLHHRTAEGIETARLNGKQIGQKKGAKLTTKKSVEAKKIIKAKSKDFDGKNNDIDCMKITGLSRNTYYKYKKQLQMELLMEESL